MRAKRALRPASGECRLDGVLKFFEKSALGLLVLAALDRNRGFVLCPCAIHVKALVADADIIAAQDPHPRKAARHALEHVVLGNVKTMAAALETSWTKSGFGL